MRAVVGNWMTLLRSIIAVAGRKLHVQELANRGVEVRALEVRDVYNVASGRSVREHYPEGLRTDDGGVRLEIVDSVDLGEALRDGSEAIARDRAVLYRTEKITFRPTCSMATTRGK